ncbi:hypothetical protein EOD39_14006 [Acipenser ruthenus]|uniref:Uncharacterized protein n=1 Tax=Acipenser ruthenus TaxID=7906 RepID=A0A662YM29_ACIRT|nr:hypothetical protein EOD39_14006 [Acipenser ruthenus]
MKGLSILLGFQMLLFPAMLVSAVEMKDRIERGVEDYYERMRRSSEMEMMGDVNEERRALDDDDDDDYRMEASERRKDEKIKRAVGHVATDRINQAAEASVDENVSGDSEEISDDERMNKVKMKETMKPSVENSPDDEDNLYRASAEGSKRKIRAHEDSDNNRVNIAGGANFKDLRLIRAIEKKQKVHHNKANGCKMKKHQKKKTADNTKEEEKTKTAAAESVAYERMKRAGDDLINKAADNEDEERMRRAWR